MIFVTGITDLGAETKVGDRQLSSCTCTSTVI
jgi:hypothetical protein